VTAAGPVALPPAAAPARRLGLVYEGRTDGERYGSWALCNRRLLGALRRLGVLVHVRRPGDPRPVGAAVADGWVSHYYPGLEPAGRFVLPPLGIPWFPWVAWEAGPPPEDWLEAWHAGRAREVWACSAHARRLLLSAGGPHALDPARVKVQPYGVDPAVFRPSGETWPVEREGVFRVLYLGGAVYRKGCDLAIRAYCRAFAPQEPTGLVLKLQGRGSFYRDAPAIQAPEDRADWQLAVSDRYSDAEVAALVRSVDVVVQPYRAEGFCLPLLEAMACGVPVVYPAHGPAPEYVPRDAGIAVGVCRGEPDVDDLARALRWLWKHPAERAAMGAAGREAAARHSWRAVALRVRAGVLGGSAGGEGDEAHEQQGVGHDEPEDEQEPGPGVAPHARQPATRKAAAKKASPAGTSAPRGGL